MIKNSERFMLGVVFIQKLIKEWKHFHIIDKNDDKILFLPIPR